MQEVEPTGDRGRRARAALTLRLVAFALLLGGCRGYWSGSRSLGPASWVQRPCSELRDASDGWREIEFQGARFRVPSDFRLHAGEGGRSVWLERPGDRITASVTTDREVMRTVGDYSGKIGRCGMEQGPRVADVVAYASPDGDFVATALWPDVNPTYSLLLTVTSIRPLAGDSLRSVLASVRFPNDSVNFKRR